LSFSPHVLGFSHKLHSCGYLSSVIWVEVYADIIVLVFGALDADGISKIAAAYTKLDYKMGYSMNVIVR